MRQFTDAEKQELQAKIEAQQERQNQAVEEFARRKQAAEEFARRNEEASMSRTLSVLGFFWKYGFLGFILCLLAFNVILVLIWEDSLYNQYAHPKYVGLVVALMLLFNHIAFYLTNKGWQSHVMKTVAVIWLVLGVAYIHWVSKVQIARMTANVDGGLGGFDYVLRSVAGFITP